MFPMSSKEHVMSAVEENSTQKGKNTYSVKNVCYLLPFSSFLFSLEPKKNQDNTKTCINKVSFFFFHQIYNHPKVSFFLNPLTDSNISAFSKLKTFAGEKINVKQNITFVFHKENIVGKGKMLVTSIFFFSLNVFNRICPQTKVRSKMS